MIFGNMCVCSFSTAAKYQRGLIYHFFFNVAVLCLCWLNSFAWRVCLRISTNLVVDAEIIAVVKSWSLTLCRRPTNNKASSSPPANFQRSQRSTQTKSETRHGCLELSASSRRSQEGCQPAASTAATAQSHPADLQRSVNKTRDVSEPQRKTLQNIIRNLRGVQRKLFFDMLAPIC